MIKMNSPAGSSLVVWTAVNDHVQQMMCMIIN